MDPISTLRLDINTLTSHLDSHPYPKGWALRRPHSDLDSLTQHSNRRSDRRPHVCAWPTATDVQLAAPATCVGTNLWMVVPSPSCPA